jgi:V/A-type H+/Na+-transporting ATPase subunit D
VADIRLTKAELRAQTVKLVQLMKYLPTLQLKKALLQAEVFNAQQELEILIGRVEEQRLAVERMEPLLGAAGEFDPEIIQVEEVHKVYENVAGVELPKLDYVQFATIEVSLFESPAWTDGLIKTVKTFLVAIEKTHVGEQKLQALKHELHEVTTRVNLFEKILIPRTKAAIKKIKVFLGDLEMGAIAQAKVAKAKILERRQGAQRREETCA